MDTVTYNLSTCSICGGNTTNSRAALPRLDFGDTVFRGVLLRDSGWYYHAENSSEKRRREGTGVQAVVDISCCHYFCKYVMLRPPASDRTNFGLELVGLIVWGISIDQEYHWMVGQVSFFLCKHILRTVDQWEKLHWQESWNSCCWYPNGQHSSLRLYCRLPSSAWHVGCHLLFCFAKS